MAKRRAIRRLGASRRVGLIDELRGILILGVVIYHLLYDLTAIYGVRIPIFGASWVGLIRDIGAGSFIFISGAMSMFSRSNFKRGALCLLCGFGLTLVTWLVMPEQLILFGILHLLGVCMLLFAVFGRLVERIPWGIGLLLALALFALTKDVTAGRIGLQGLFSWPLPEVLYSTKYLFFLGLPGPGLPASADYYPLLPWVFLFFAGSHFGKPLREGSFPDGMYQTRFRSFAFLGKHTIWIYLLHQPVLIGVLELVFRLKEQLSKGLPF